MKLFLLKPIHKKGDDPWSPWYDKAFGFVIRAESEEQARALAQANGGDEVRQPYLYPDPPADYNIPWNDATYSTCELLYSKAKGSEEILMRDHRAA